MRLLAALVFSVAAASAAAATEITWESAAAEAARANPTLNSSRLSVDASRASYYSSWNAFMPSLSLSNGVSESKGSRQPSYSAGASAGVTLFSVGSAASIRSASAAVSSAEASLRAASAALRANLRQAYSNLLFSQYSLEVSRGIDAIRKHDAELVTLRYDSGRESKGNMLRSKAQRLQSGFAVSSAERDLRSAQRELGRQLGRDAFEEFTATGAFASAPPPPRPSDFRDLLPLRTDVAVAEASVRSAEASRLSAESVWYPTASASYSRSKSGPTEFPNRTDSWSAGASLSWSIFGGGPTAAYYNNKASALSLERSRSDLAAARQSAVSDLEQKWAAYVGAAEQVQVQDALLESARQRNDEADIRYASGLMSFDIWEGIVSERVSTERAALSARKSAMDAETAWHRALGRALGE